MIGSDIKQAREKMGLSQEAAAKAIRNNYQVRLSSAYLSMIERGDRDNLTSKLEKALRDFFKLNAGPALQSYHHCPVLGAIRTGVPLSAQESYPEYLDVPGYFPAGFVLQVTGESMVGAGILDGDYVVCSETETAPSGQIVVALRDLGTGFSEAHLRYYLNNGKGSFLRAANPQIRDVPLKGNYQIAGVMEGLIRKSFPGYHIYRDYLNTGSMGNWGEVMEKAENYGLTPQQLSANLDMHWEMAKRMRLKE